MTKYDCDKRPCCESILLFLVLFANDCFMSSNSHPHHTDIQSHGWWHRLPAAMHPFIHLTRLDRPIGWWLLLLPSWWSISLAAPTTGIMLRSLALFLIGAIVTRAAGCIINDMWDRKLDQRVDRTKARPLATGTISTTKASLLLIALGLVGLIILFQLPILAVYVGLAAVPLVILYPLAKRVTWFPQFVLGLTFSWGVLLGWTAVTENLPEISIFWIYAGCVAWVFGYDTIYAIQDMKDDRRGGVKSSALAFGSKVRNGIAAAYVMAIILAWVGLAAMAIHLGVQVYKIRIDDAKIALYLFKSNRNAGLLLFAGLVLDRLFFS